MKSFHTQILILLKRISPCSITHTARTQVNVILQKILNKIINVSVQLLNDTGRTTLTTKTTTNAIRLLVTGELQKNMLVLGKQFRDEMAATCVFPPSLLRQQIKEFTASIRIGAFVSHFLSGVLEYLCVELLDVASLHCIKRHRRRIYSCDVQRSVEHDKEFHRLVRTLNIVICGGKGTKELVLPRSYIENTIRTISREIEGENVKIAEPVLAWIHHYIEHYLKELLVQADKLCMHTQRVKIAPKDILFVLEAMDRLRSA
jgi:histone H3/H4